MSGRRAAPGTAPDGRLRELDLLRFVAAAAVMLYHFTAAHTGSAWGNASKVYPEISRVTNWGNQGVNLFFVISGFVILMSVWGRSPGQFAASRFTRLFPAYWAGVTLALIIYLGSGAYFHDTPSREGPIERFLPNLTMLQDGIGAAKMEGVYWTLWVELHFYALIALLVWRGITYRRCVAFMGIWLLLGVFALQADSAFLKVLLIPTMAPYFIAGMALYLIYRFGSNLVPWLFVAVCWALSVYFGGKYIDPRNALPGLYHWVVPLVITLIFAVMVLVATGRLAWLRWRRLTPLGALTYPLYLVHETVSRPMIKAVKGHLDPWIVLALCIVVALSTAYLIYAWIEEPVQHWLRPRLRRALVQIRANGATVATTLTTPPADSRPDDAEQYAPMSGAGR